MIFKLKEKNGHVVILQRDRVVKAVSSQSAGKKFIKFLISGGAFNGEVPEFMLKTSD